MASVSALSLSLSFLSSFHPKTKSESLSLHFQLLLTEYRLDSRIGSLSHNSLCHTLCSIHLLHSMCPPPSLMSPLSLLTVTYFTSHSYFCSPRFVASFFGRLSFVVSRLAVLRVTHFGPSSCEQSVLFVPLFCSPVLLVGVLLSLLFPSSFLLIPTDP